AHVVVVERVPQAVLDHGVDELDVAHLGAVAHVGGVHGPAHALLAAGNDDGRIARLNLLRTECHRTQPRAADLVDAPGRRVDGNAGRDGSLPCGALTLSGGKDLAEDDLGYVARL